MRDDNDGLSVIAHASQHGEQLLRLLRRQHGRRLIKDQDVRTAVQYLDDLHGLLLRHRHVVDLLVRINVETVALADLAHALRVRAQIKAALVLEAEDYVFRRRENIHQLKMLVDHSDPVGKCVARGADVNPLSVDEDRTPVRIVNAGDHIHQRRLAAAVLSENGEDLAPFHPEGYVLVGDHAAEGLRYAPQLYCGCAVCAHAFPPKTNSAGRYGPAERNCYRFKSQSIV